MADEQYDGIIKKAVLAAAAAGPLVLAPVPGPADVAMGAINGIMLVAIARHNNQTFDEAVAKRIILGVTAGAGAYYSGVKFFLWLVAKVPGIGMIAGAGATSTINVAVTLWLAFAMVDLFERHDSIDADFCTEFLSREMKPGVNLRKLKRIKDFMKRLGG